MRFAIDLAVAVIIAAMIGVTSAWFMVEQGRVFGATRVGAWTAWPLEGSAAADPYSVAMLARTGEVPLGAGEGLSFTADADTAGEPLSGQCTYTISGETPAARLWTITAYDSGGKLMANVAHRASFHSREIVRRADGSFTIVISASVQPGNWLPTAPVDGISLVLRLYDTPLTTGSQIADLAMPTINRTSCP